MIILQYPLFHIVFTLTSIIIINVSNLMVHLIIWLNEFLSISGN